jgi:hypothetical protein
MKKLNVMMALVAMTAGASMVQAEESSPCSAKKQEVTACKVNAEEQAFAGKLNEQNRKSFEQFSAEQKKAAMAAAAVAGANKVALNPNDAVQKVAKENVTVADKVEVKAEVKAAAPVVAPAKAK